MTLGEPSGWIRRLSLTSEGLAVALLFVAIAVLASIAPAQSDTWWQLRAGEEIWNTGRAPLTETYSHTARGADWPNHEWLSEALFFAAYRAGGISALATLCAISIVLACALSWRLLRGPFEIRFGLFVVGLTSVVPAWSLRPQVFSLAFFMVTCTLLGRNSVWWLPPLFLVWANLHGGVGLGLLAIGAVMMVETIRTRRLPWHLIGVFLACLVATALTPLRLELWTLLATYGQKGKISRISEWMAPGPPPAYLAFWVIAVLFLVCAVLFVRRSDQTAQRLTAVSLIALPLALTAHRQVPAFLLVAMPATAALLDTARRRTGTRPPARDHNLANTGLAAVAVVVASVWILSLRSQPPPRLNWRPIADAAILAVKTCHPPFYNAFDLGGVLIWFVREQPVFIDNRNDPYPATLLEHSLDVETTGDYRALFNQYGIRCAAVEVDTPTERTLRQDRGWQRTYADDRHAVYIRPGS